MKKLLCIVLALGLAFASCKKQEEAEVPNSAVKPNEVKYQIKVLSQDTVEKSSLESIQKRPKPSLKKNISKIKVTSNGFTANLSADESTHNCSASFNYDPYIEYVDWYLVKNGVEVAYIGATSSTSISFDLTSPPSGNYSVRFYPIIWDYVQQRYVALLPGNTGQIALPLLSLSGASFMPKFWESRAVALSSGHSSSDYITPSDTTPFLSSDGTDSKYSNNGLYRLIMQADGNLVLYKISTMQSLWGSNTYNSDFSWRYRVYFQTDGNLVIKRWKSGVAEQDIWASNTEVPISSPIRRANSYRAYLLMQDDGNLAMYFNGLDGRAWSLEYSTATSGGLVSSRQGSLK